MGVRTRSMLSPTALVTALAVVVACPQDPEPEDRPPELCQPAPALGEGPYFTDVTATLGLGPDGLDAQGSLAASADVDGDRWPDLFLSKNVQGARDDPAAPGYNVRLLRNLSGQGFEDITFNSGFTTARDGGHGRATQFAVFGDVDNDGDADAFVANFVGEGTVSTGDSSELLLNQGGGSFSLGPAQRFSDDAAYDAVISAATLDYDHDGWLDLFVGHHYAQYGLLDTAGQDSLFRGDGQGGFTDVTQAAGLKTMVPITVGDLEQGRNHRATWGVSACDVNGDSFADLLVSAYGRAWNLLYLANGDGSFREEGRALGFAADANEDYSDNLMYRCHCHTYGGDCDPMPPPPYGCFGEDYWYPAMDAQPFRLGGNSSNTLCGDLDNDGDLDLLQVELRHAWAGLSSDATELLFNEGVGTTGGAFARPGNATTGLTRWHALDWNEGDLGGALLDFDNDGRLDALVASSDYPDTFSLLWRQQEDGSFVELTERAGLKQHRAHGLTLLDYDRDGDYDVLQGTSLARWAASDTPPRPEAAYVHLYRNDVGQDANRLIIHLEGAGAGGANRDAVGARVEVRVGDQLFVREQQGGHGLAGQQNDALMIIGVGAHCTVDSVEVAWPDAARSRQTFEEVRANYVLHIRQGQELRYLTLEEYRAGG